MNELKSSAVRGRLYEFEVSETLNYLLEFGNLCIRFSKDRVQIPATEVVTPYLEADLPYLKFTQSGDTLYIAHPSYQTRTLTRTSDTVWTLALYVTTDGPYLPINRTDTELTAANYSYTGYIQTTAASFVIGDVGRYVEYAQEGEPRLALITSYTSATLVGVTIKQNVLAPLDPVTVLTYGAPTITASHAVFSNANVGAYIRRAPGNWHLVTVYTSETQIDVAAAVSLVATAGVVSLVNTDIAANVLATADTFVATDVNRHIRLNFSGEQVWGTIFAYVGVREVAVHFDRPIPLKDIDPTTLIDDGRTVSWRLGAWSATTGWPAVVAFHEQRIAFAATPTEIQTFWLSRSGNYTDHAPTDNQSKVLDDNGVTFTIASNRLNAIRWMLSGPTLIFGTTGGEWQASASSIREAITPTNISVLPHTDSGSGHVRPLRSGSAILFTPKSGAKLRELIYDYQTDSLVAKDMTIISEHILKRGGKTLEVALQKEPNSIMWHVLNDGGLVGFTYVRDQEVFAWHYHEIGGAFGTGKAVVESAASLTDSTGAFDTLYLIVKRTINGATKRYIEYMDVEYDPPTESSREELYYVDCGKKTTSGGTSSVALAHLPNATVSVLADGSVRPSITLDAAGNGTFAGGAAMRIMAGYMYDSLLVTLPPEAQGEAGTAQGKTKRVQKAKVRVYKSMGFKYGPSEAKLSQYNFRNTLDPMNLAPPIRSADIPLTIEGSYEYEGSVTIKRDQPYPLNIIAMMPEFVVNE